MYLAEKGVEKNKQEALYLLGGVYYFGSGVTADAANGVELWEKASALGLPQAQYSLVVNYFFGIGAKKTK